MRKADTGDKVEFLAEVGVLAQKQGKQLIPLNHLLPSSLKARLHWDGARASRLLHKSGGTGSCLEETRARFGAECCMMWFLVFISTNAIICCPTIVLLNEKILRKQTSTKPTALCYRKDKVNFSLPSPQPIRASAVWCHPHFPYYIQSQFFCLLV